MHHFESQFSLQGAYYGKSASSVFSNGAFEETDKANLLLGGTVVGTKYEALRFRTIVLFFVVAVTTYQSSAAAATAAILVQEGPSPDPLQLRLGVLSDIPP